MQKSVTAYEMKYQIRDSADGDLENTRMNFGDCQNKDDMERSCR